MVSLSNHTIQQLAKLAGVSVRTLHHYDAIGLLRPTTRMPNGYRIYGESELLRLQQILFYKELDFPLEDIRKLLDQPEFKLDTALLSHKTKLQHHIQRLQTLLRTVDKTLLHLKDNHTMLTDEELYEGFSKEEIAQLKEYEKEAEQRWDPNLVKQSQEKVRRMSKEQWKMIGEEGKSVTADMAKLIGKKEVGDPDVQKVIARHHAWISNFYTPTAEMYRGLGQMYSEDPRFTAYYDKFAKGLADYMQQAIDYYCEHTLTRKG